MNRADHADFLLFTGALHTFFFFQAVYLGLTLLGSGDFYASASHTIVPDIPLGMIREWHSFEGRVLVYYVPVLYL